ncbi:unnamed protein product [Lathyrus oleraceus]
MAEIIKFIYVMIMILLISKNVDAAVFSCLQDSECPHNLCPAPSESNCIYGVCNCVIKTTDYHDRGN